MSASERDFPFTLRLFDTLTAQDERKPLHFMLVVPFWVWRWEGREEPSAPNTSRRIHAVLIGTDNRATGVVRLAGSGNRRCQDGVGTSG